LIFRHRRAAGDFPQEPATPCGVALRELSFAKGATPMRGRKRPALIDVSILLELAGHAAMGAALGLGFSLALMFFDAFGLKSLIAGSVDPGSTARVLVGTFTLVFAVGASLTGFVLTMVERGERSADQ
jgi:hypothetical protein